ncbi:MAG: Glu-tRNA(Gln) amidotransferase subunit GatD [Candidatus Diapherotrites archaeon]
MPVREFLKQHKLKEGDTVRVEQGASEFEGTIIPSAEKNLLALKLKSGYNTLLELKDLKVKKLGEGAKVGKAEARAVEKKPGLPTISVLHTGGTIASRVDYRTGAVYSSFSPQDLLSMYPELERIANFSPKFVANMWSDDFRFKHFEILGKAVEEEIRKGVHGIIIGMGTDNLAVASAALAFVLEDVPVPVILVGAQRSSDRGSSDAAMNLVCAATFISKTDFAGVAICMHETSQDDWCAILPACKTRKLHSSRRDAFQPVNDSVIARINYNSKQIAFVKKEYLKRDSKRALKLKPKFEEKVGLLKIHINMFPEEFGIYSKWKYKGLVIEGTGLGQTPGHVPNEWAKENAKIFPEIKQLIQSGCVVVMTSQCIFGRVQMHVYDKAMDLVELGVIPGEDMLSETAFVKLAWLLGNYPKDQTKKLIAKNLRGEISERSSLDYSVQKMNGER